MKGRSLPAGYVLREFQALLECGDPAFGFCRLRCPSCATDMVIPFSCKRRTFCPSCGGRQMAQTAAHLVDRVLPDVPIRQWVLSVPKPLRLALAMDASLCRDVTRAHLRAVSASYVRRAKAALDLEEDEAEDEPQAAGVAENPSTCQVQFHPGAVNATHRFGSALELNVHQHSLYLDGVYVTRGPFDPPVFMPAGLLDSDEVGRVHSDVIGRIRRVLERYDLKPLQFGLPPRPGDDAADADLDLSEYEQPLLDFGDARGDAFLPGLKSASVNSAVPFGPRAGLPVQRLRDPNLARGFESSGWSGQRVSPPLVENSNGFSLHAATVVPEGERDRLEKLCRYVSRPALCLKRLEVRSDGKIVWSLRKVWRDGTKSFVFTPHEFIARLAALVPHPREHQLTYQGVLAPASPLRDQVVPRPVIRKEPREVDASNSQDSEGSAGESSGSKGSTYIRWADLLKRVFAEDILSCPRCRGRRHMVSVITDPETVARFLESVRRKAKSQASAGNGGGGDGCSQAEGRAPPTGRGEQIPKPPRQGRLDFGNRSGSMT